MKKHLLAALSILALAAAGCKEETKNYPPATVEIQNIVPQDVSVQFELAHTNAVSVGYRIEDAATDTFINFDIRTHCGLSMYLPADGNSELDEFYKTLSWNKASGLVL